MIEHTTNVNCRWATIADDGHILCTNPKIDIPHRSEGSCLYNCPDGLRDPIDPANPNVLFKLPVMGAAAHKIWEERHPIIPIDPKELIKIQRRTWGNLHWFFSRDRTPDARRIFLARFEKSIIGWASCDCNNEYKQFIARCPHPAWNARWEDWFAWTVLLHNVVNGKLTQQGKHRPQMMLGDAIRRWRTPRKIIITVRMAPGDTVVGSAVVRDLDLAFPGEFAIDVRMSCHEDFFHNNPRLTSLMDDDPDVDWIELQLLGEESPLHYIQQFVACAENALFVPIPCTAIMPELYPVSTVSPFDKPYAVVNVGWKESNDIKKLEFSKVQEVVNRFPDILWVQVGEGEKAIRGDDVHHHPPLIGDNVVNLVGKTSWAETVELVKHAAVVLTPTSALMHIAAGVDTPAVVVAGGREHPDWTAYRGHEYLHRIGAFDCCKTKGCWKKRIVAKSPDDKECCVLPRIDSAGANVPACIQDISVDEIATAIKEVMK